MARTPARWASQAAASSSGRRPNSAERRPCLSALLRERALPASVRGPRERALLAREAVGLYCAGLSLNATAKRLGVSAQSVMRWVRDHARDHCPKPAPEGRAVVVEIDEVWHFVQKKPASSGSGRCSSARPAG